MYEFFFFEESEDEAIGNKVLDGVDEYELGEILVNLYNNFENIFPCIAFN